MHEQARQHYLDAMGIQTYMPRLVLPAAPVPRQCDLSGLVSASTPQAPLATKSLAATDSAPSDTQTPQSVDALLASMGAAPSAAVAPAKKPVKAVAPLAASVSFSVSLWQFAGITVIADRHPEQALPVNLLLKNILVALGRTQDATDNPEVIRWPLEGVPAAQAGPAAAYFYSLLLARRLPAQTTTLLCFGEVIGAQLAGQAIANYQTTTLALSEQDSMPMIALPGLDAILIDPQLKAPVWAAIAQLRQP
jgi:hypothetical protein